MLDFTSSAFSQFLRTFKNQNAIQMNLVWRELHLATNALSKEPLNDHERQCFACQKRGKKCDSTPISCLRCQNDNIECPGYAKILSKLCRQPFGNNQNGRGKTKSSWYPSTSLQAVPATPQDTKDWVTLLESIKYYNGRVVPYSKPAHLPYRRQNLEIKHWDLMPDILRSLWIITMGAMQAGRSDADPLSNSELVQYRGRSLKELQQLMKDVPAVVNDPFGVALYSIIFVMAFEMQIPGSQWSSHLEAARRIIALKGGLVKCFAAFPTITHGPLVSSMMADTITATTCPARLLNQAFMQTQREWLDVLPGIEQDLIASGYSYPLPLLLMLVQTNMLRGHLHCNNLQDNDLTPFDFDFSTLLQTVQTFDAERWASRVSAFGRARPESADNAIPTSGIICLASLAHCYKSAVTLYLVLSTSANLAFIDPQLRQTIRIARHALSQHLSLLFEQGQTRNDRGCDGPLHTQLWKFVTWPLFVSLYVRAGWQVIDPTGHSMNHFQNEIDSVDAMGRDMGHLRAISAATGTRKFAHVEKLAQRVQRSRAAAASKGIETAWNWNDAFNVRSVFVV